MKLPRGLNATFDDWVGFFPTLSMFAPILGEMIQIDEHIFQMGWFSHQLLVVVI